MVVLFHLMSRFSKSLEKSEDGFFGDYEYSIDFHRFLGFLWYFRYICSPFV